MELDKINTVFCEKIKKLEIEDLLNEIFRRFEAFIRFYGYSPNNITLKITDYYRIKIANENLFKKVDDDEYLLGMKVHY
jgi:hypothetical protein